MAEAGPSRPSIKSQYATFVFDSSLPRDRYVSLTELNGVIQLLIKRLLEKHQGETNLHLRAVICPDQDDSPPLPPESFETPSKFLARLPKLKARFDVDPSDGVTWPAFQEKKPQRRKKWERQAESGLLNGVVDAVEDMASAAGPSTCHPPELFSSLCPPEAKPILTALYTPPSSPPPPPSGSISRYLFLFGYDNSNSGDERAPKVTGDSSDIWQGLGWEGAGAKCGDLGVKVSVIYQGIDSGRGNRLKAFAQSSSADPPTQPWFPLAPNTTTHLSGLTLSSSTLPVPLPPIARSSPVPSNVGTPLVSVESPQLAQPTLASSLQSNPAMALQYLRQKGGTLPGGLTNPAVSAALANFMAAAKNGAVDVNDPQMAQIRQFLMMQQQQKQAQNQPQPPAPPQQPSAPSEQDLMAAMSRQRAQQAQQNVGQVRQPSAPARVWSGEIIWPTNDSTSISRLAVDATMASAASVDAVQLAAVIPNELRITSSNQIDNSFLTTFVKEFQVPVLQFDVSASAPPESGNRQRLESLVNGLSQKSTVGIIPVGEKDRGVMLCAVPSNGPIPRLLGVLCITVPFPNISRTPQPSAPPLPVQPTAPPIQQQPPQFQPVQIQKLLEQGIKLGIQLPPDMTNTNMTNDHVKMLIQAIKAKSTQRQQQMQQQQQQQQQQMQMQMQQQQMGQMQGGMDLRFVQGDQLQMQGMSMMQGQGQGQVYQGQGYVQGQGQ